MKLFKEFEMENQQKDGFSEPSSEISRSNLTLARCNHLNIKLLKQLGFGRYGVLTVASQFWYGYLVSKNTNNVFSSTLKDLATKNFNLANELSENILSNNGVLKFNDSQGNFWSARNLSYDLTKETFIRNTTNILNNSLKKLKVAQNRTNNESTKNLIEKIIISLESDLNTINS